ncbi:chromosomal replication initiation protein [Kosmotoga arenicorallina S304]|uniref:Chromosomal replication initiator protein DnaA n=1 Tax=Kosmotoga arenicorallina S304 TaxID=1453497 RepID=A0A182C818_9BACT|nr:chromosomal replication initiator protein DnaA [Kosmotoga arenicorallina]OAA31893.1 chromosomal replication initiation protein [Kosmotoga arenicorallina S304]
MSHRIIRILEKKLSRKTWDNWFTTLEIKEITGDKVIFQVGNLFVKDWLQSRYGKVIHRAIHEALGKDLDFEIVYESPSKEVFESDEYKGPLVKKKPLILSELNPEYTFENFVVGTENRALFEISQEICRKPGKFNPFFIFGGVGLGKTHLLQAIAHRVLELFPEKKVLYITSEQFMNDMIDAIKSGSIRDFRYQYRKKADVLLIDDVQFLIGKEGTQRELFHTFNELHDAGKQIVICSDRTPDELNGFPDRLVSRFQMGMVMEILPPSLETRYEIAKRLARRESINLADDVAMELAHRIDGNLRRLRGAIIKLIVQSSMYKEKIDLSFTRQIISSFQTDITGVKPLTDVDRLLKAIEKVLGVSREEIKGTSRTKNVVKARQLFIYMLKQEYGKSVQEIAEIVGKKHSTVIHSVKQISKSILKDNKYIKGLVAKINNTVSTDFAAS